LKALGEEEVIPVLRNFLRLQERVLRALLDLLSF
jgi:hypothetical protein